MIWTALLAVALGGGAAFVALWRRVNALEDDIAKEAAARAEADLALISKDRSMGKQSVKAAYSIDLQKAGVPYRFEAVTSASLDDLQSEGSDRGNVERKRP